MLEFSRFNFLSSSLSLLFSDVNRFGGGITSTIIGPMGELADKTAKLTIGNMQEAILGEETNVLGEAAQYLKSYVPKAWETRRGSHT